MQKALKKVLLIGVIVIMGLSIFTACSNDSEFAIDVGGEGASSNSHILQSVQSRVMLENDVFRREDDISITVGFGFVSHDIRWLNGTNLVLALRINAQNFLIENESGETKENLYERIFEDFSDSKFIATLIDDRVVPNYYENFLLRFNSNTEDFTGFIQAFGFVFYPDEPDNRNGRIVTIFYATNSSHIAFSAISRADAESKL